MYESYESQFKEHYETKIIIGNFIVMIDKKFNWFHRLMVKLLLGFDMKRVKGE